MAFIRGIPISALPRVLAARGGIAPATRHVFLAICDHWEPKRDNASPAVARERVARWSRDYPALCAGLADSGGRPPQQTFFYPAEDYEAEYLDALAELREAGLGDVEVHLHHDNDTSDHLRETLEQFRDTLAHRHGMLARDESGRITYGFIHGNWALDNSHPSGRWCGVNDELTILRETGCYADFTMPSAPTACQTRTVNSIYYAADNPQQPNSHDRGVAARAGRPAPADRLLMIQGPLAADWSWRKWGVIPRIENGDLTKRRPPSLRRLALWGSAHVHVAGRPDWLFIKLHTHGAKEDNAEMLLGEPMRQFHEALAERARGASWKYWYVTAREMAHLVHQAERGAAEPTIRSCPPATVGL